jgi:hypothetical protein
MSSIRFDAIANCYASTHNLDSDPIPFKRLRLNLGRDGDQNATNDREFRNRPGVNFSVSLYAAA